MAADGELEGVRVGHEVSAHPVGVDQFEDPGAVVEVTFVGRGDVGDPPHRLVRDAQRAEDSLVEVVLAEQQLVHTAQILAGLRTLDDPVVVGAGQRDDLRDRQLRQRLGGGALELGRVLHGTDADDRPLTLHQARHRMHGADATGVGQSDRHIGEVVGGELVRPGPPHKIFVGEPELAEVHGLGLLDRSHHQLPGGPLDQVDRETEVDVLRCGQSRLAVHLGIGVVHGRRRLERLDHRVPDQMGERDLAATGTGQMPVDDDPVVRDQLGRHRAYGGRRRDVQGRLHVGDDSSSGTTQW